MEDPALTVKQIKNKIKNLRSVFHTEKKKVEASIRSGAGTADVYKPSMPWFTEMEAFIGDVEDYRASIGSDLVSIFNMYLRPGLFTCL